MLCLVGPRRRVGPVMRVDLRPGGGVGREDQLMAIRFAEIAAEHADEVAVLCYTERDQTPLVARTVIAELQSVGVHIIDAARITAGRAWSIPAAPPGTKESDFEDKDEGCAIPAAEDPQVQAMAAAIALNGRGILADRRALAESIAGPVGQAAERASASLHAAYEGLLGEGHTALEPHRLHQMAWCAIDVALQQSMCGPVGPAIIAQINLLLCDTEIRGGLIRRTLVDPDEPWLPMLIAVARAVPDEDAAEVCTVLAIAAYRAGDGALAQVAVDRALVGEPNHALARFMLDVVSAGVHPSELLELVGPALGLNPEMDG